MRSAIQCVIFALIIHISRVRNEEFRPTPIPLDEWQPTKSDNAGTLHEVIGTQSPASVAAVPAHYWEDALRHSVYLTLVRDKIDQLIAKGDIVGPGNKPNQSVSKEIDDHDLWEKIKKAPFDRIQAEEPNALGDVTIMAKGRLMESKDGFRFTEDERSQESCSDDRCANGVKAFWSVKRVRQRDQEISPGKYHYELTFSVISQIPKKQRKPYENPMRTFTVRETVADRITDVPQEYKRTEPMHYQTARPQRAIWFHKNIVPIPPHTRRPYYSSLDRIFSSIFSDDDASSYDQPQPKYRNHQGSQQAYQYSKIGHAGPSLDHHYQQTKTVPYPYKHQPYKFVRPPLQAPPAGPLQHHYLDYDSSPIVTGNPYPSPSQDTRVSSSQPVKSTRPAFLPTPVPTPQGPKEQTFDLGSPVFIDSTDIMENGTKFTDMNSNSNFRQVSHKHKVMPTKPTSNYFPEHIRPPVYNAPPGVFVTMDKKPFKPMPPLKLVHNNKPHRANKPVDFRPSPQVHDSHSQHSDPSFDTAFRPITVNYADSSSTESNEHNDTVKKSPSKNRKTHSNSKKPSKKQENTKSQRITTPTPDIITAGNLPDDDIDTLDWANVLGAFTKTTPMVIQTEKSNFTETTTSFSTTTSTTTAPTLKRTTTVETTSEPTFTKSAMTTTPRPKKRTRPPPKFTKQDKFKKNKRIITASSTVAPEISSLRRYTTEAPTTVSTTAKMPKKTFWETKNKTLPSSTTSTTSTSTTTRASTTRFVSTTTPTTTTTTTTSTTTSAPMEITSTTKPDSSNQTRKRNRFRQSTLIYKGTSVKHDRWSYRNSSGSQSPNYRRTSNFQGYSSSTTPVSTQKVTVSSVSSTIGTESPSTEKYSSTQGLNNDVLENFESNNVLPTHNDNTESEISNDSQDHSEYIFDQSTGANENSNEVIGLEGSITTESISQQYGSVKNKTKCQKKKLNSSTTEDPKLNNSEEITTPKTTTEDTSTDIFQQLFGFNFNSESSTKESELLEQESTNHASFFKEDDELTDFMEELNGKGHFERQISDDEYDDDDDDDDGEELSDDDDNDDDDDEEESKPRDNVKTESSRDSRYESYNLDRPYSFLELMAME